ncbi:MAG: hypothetical protein SFX73_30020 [Kofleriaceae bacterium]|nr:hypothetical protein [Kofleriaceae bacterium]
MTRADERDKRVGMVVGPRLRSLGVAALVALGLLLATKQLGCHGAYSNHAAYRAQVDAFLDGRLALSRSPEALAHDLAWTESGVQQVWGLGVPLWQTPFEVGARAVGQGPFPDRLALAAWLVLVGFVLLRAFRRREGESWWLGAGSVVIAGLLPAFVTLIRARLGVYEEAAIYAYGAAMILLGGVVILARAPTRTRYLVLLAAAGLTGLIRPTVWFYGLATAIVATWIYVQAHGRRVLPIVALGAGLFVAGGGALYLTNQARFGKGSEFGHRLNIHALPGNIYATRFSYPFERAGWGEATAELVGATFGRPEQFERKGFYLTDLHVGQSEKPRWREYYFTTFSWPYLPLIVAGMVLAALAWRKRGEARGDAVDRWLGVWALIGLLPLFVFYLRAPAISSRYQLDMAPAFAAWLVIAWRAGSAWLTARGKGVLGFAVLLALWATAIATSHKRGRIAADPTDREHARASTAKIASPVVVPRTMPTQYVQGDPMWIATKDHEAPLYLNGIGWDVVTGRAPVAAHFFVEAPQFVEVVVEPADAEVRVAIGLEQLRLASTTKTDAGAVLRFELAHPLEGLRVAFVAFGPDTEIDQAQSNTVLRSIRWRDSVP